MAIPGAWNFGDARLVVEPPGPTNARNQFTTEEDGWKRAVTADTALRLARYFSTSERFWLNLQSRYDLEIEKDRLGNRLQKEVAVLARAS
jgi:hypothetical protein